VVHHVSHLTLAEAGVASGYAVFGPDHGPRGRVDDELARDAPRHRLRGLAAAPPRSTAHGSSND
jgi:hypothetical protein